MGLPALREELDLFEGPRKNNGQPTWVLQDPVRQQFFRIDWLTFEILSRWSMNDPEAIMHAIERDTPLEVEPEDLEKTVKFLSEQQLLRPDGFEAISKMAERKQASQSCWWQWLIHHYLFFRVPLVRPDRWLGRWLPVANVFFSQRFLALTAGALLLGLYQVSRQWDHFSAFLWDTLTLEGLAAYGVALFVVKLLHELGHAFAVKRNGCRVPTMGVAFLVMCPMAYTDTNEAWRMANRWQRLQASAAGIATEGIVAVWATLAWAFLPEGALRSSMFFLAAISWGISLLLNASPFMRFDGYFILCDALDMPNLHQRSFALARWKMREWLFGLNEQAPEIFTPVRQKALLLMAFATWTYRLVLFLGIAALVYYFFFKMLGVVLFGVEIIWFVLLPIYQEIKVWRTLWPQIKQRSATRRSAWLAILLVMACVIPWPTRVHVSALLRPADLWPIYVPAGARVDSLPFREGDHVNQGATLVTLTMPELASREAQTRARLAQQQWQAATAGMNADSQRSLLVAQETYATVQAEMSGIRAESALYQPKAPFAGWIRDLDPDLQAGQWIPRKERIGLLVRDDGRWLVETWLEEEDVRRISLGDSALFITDATDGAALHLTVTAIDQDASRLLPRPELSSTLGGHVLTREKQGQHFPERAIYRVVLATQEPPGALNTRSWRGKLTIHGSWEPPLWRYLRQALTVAVRESGF